MNIPESLIQWDRVTGVCWQPIDMTIKDTRVEAWTRAHACLSELGYTDRNLVWIDARSDRVAIGKSVPLAVAYMTLFLSYPDDPHVACWTCYALQSVDAVLACYGGECPGTGPKMPPKELLVSRSVR